MSEALGPSARRHGTAVRAFFAWEPEAAAKSALAALVAELRRRPDGDAVRWVKPEGYHLTLRFLGNVATSEVPGYILMLILPLVFVRTISPQRSPALPQGKAVPTTVESRYSDWYCAACAFDCPNAGETASASANAATTVLDFTCFPYVKVFKLERIRSAVMRDSSSSGFA